MRFTIYDAATDGTLAGALTNSATGITNGLFTVTLDFGYIFNGTNCWLELAARTNGSDTFSPLSPRLPILPTPYAIYAATAGSAVMATTATTASSANSVAAANIVGIVLLAQMPGAVVTNNANFNAGTINVSSNIYLPATTANAGIIYSGSGTLRLADQSGNFFAGYGAGNLALARGPYITDNTGIGNFALSHNTIGSRKSLPALWGAARGMRRGIDHLRFKVVRAAAGRCDTAALRPDAVGGNSRGATEDGSGFDGRTEQAPAWATEILRAQPSPTFLPPLPGAWGLSGHETFEGIMSLEAICNCLFSWNSVKIRGRRLHGI